MKRSGRFIVAIYMLLMVSGAPAFALPVSRDLAAWHPEKFECGQDISADCPYFGAYSKFLGNLDRPFAQGQDVLGVANLQAVANLRLIPWNLQRISGHADGNSMPSSRLTQKLLTPAIGSVKIQVGGGLQFDGTVFVRFRNTLKNNELLSSNSNEYSGTARTTLFREGRLGILRPLDANILLSNTLIGEGSHDYRSAGEGKSQKIVEQSMGYKYLAFENPRLTVGRQLGGAWFDTAASVQEVQFASVVKIDSLSTSFGSAFYRLIVDGRRGRWLVLERPVASQERSGKSLLAKSETATTFQSDSISVLVNHNLNRVVTTTTAVDSSVYPTENRHSRALFLSKLKTSAAATLDITTNN